MGGTGTVRGEGGGGEQETFVKKTIRMTLEATYDLKVELLDLGNLRSHGL